MIERKKHDIAVIGAGPGGYVAAIKAAQLGKSVALIDKGFLGGCCLNEGCIPTKALLANAAVLHTVRHAASFGIHTGSISIHYDEMKRGKDALIAKIRSGLEGLLKSNQITIYRGQAQFESPFSLQIQGQDNLYVQADKIIIATGSIPIDIKAFPCDHQRILNSTSLLEIIEIPKRLAIVGGGYIGCEFATLFAELGTKVTILEALPTILAAQGGTIAEFMTQKFRSKNIDIQTGAMVKAIENRQDHVQIALNDGKVCEADLALIAVGRKIYTEGLSLQKAGLSLQNNGSLATNDQMETAVRGIYAIGDVTGSWMLAHVASHQGIVAAMNACGRETSMHYNAVPAVIFTSPEIATVGLSQEMAREKGLPVTVGRFPFSALGKAQASRETEGFSQILADAKTGQILGACIIGHDASNLIGEMALAIQNELTLESVIETIHAHPTMSEGWHEAAFSTLGMPLHLPPAKKRL